MQIDVGNHLKVPIKRGGDPAVVGNQCWESKSIDMSEHRLKTKGGTENTPFVSVVLPVYNDNVRLKECLLALSKQTYPPTKFEVVVVDNGSDTPLSRVASYCSQARIIVHSQAGSYAARNAGIQESLGEILAFTDSDCLPASEWLQNGVDHIISRNKNMVLGGRIEFFFRDGRNPTACELYESVFGFNQQHYIEKSHFAATANMFTTREVVKKIRQFNSKLISGGDREWGQRASKGGVSLAYLPSALVYHPARHTLNELKKKYRRVTVGKCRLVDEGSVAKRWLIIKLVKILPSVRYRIIPALRSKELTALGKMRVLLLIFYLHYYLYWYCLIRVDSLWKTAHKKD